jgi:hypothetical protein
MPAQHVRNKSWDYLKANELEASSSRNAITKASEIMNLILEREIKELKKMTKAKRDDYYKSL